MHHRESEDARHLQLKFFDALGHERRITASDKRKADQRGDVLVDHIGRCQRTVGRANTGAMLLRRAPNIFHSLIMYRSLQKN
jgi:hypothetical protein